MEPKPGPLKNLLPILLLLVSFSAPAQIGGARYAFDFDGSNDDVSIPDDSTLNPLNNLSIEAWIKADSYAKNIYENSIFCKHTWANGREMGYVFRCGSGGALSFNLAKPGGGWEELTTKSVMSTGQWYHVAATYDSDSMKIYVNGVKQASKAYSSQIRISTNHQAKIGELSYGSGRNFDGQIDEVRVWNVALPDSVIRGWMCRSIQNTHPLRNRLKGYWPLNAGSGTTVVDMSGKRNNGTANNGPVWGYSQAAIGDTSIYVYNNTNPSLSLTGLDSSEVLINRFKGSFKGVHFYAAKRHLISGTSGSGYSPDTFGFYGAFLIDDSSATFDMRLNYAKTKGKAAQSECVLDLLVRNPKTDKWDVVGANQYLTADSFSLSKMSEGEWIIGRYNGDKKIRTGTGDSIFCSSDSLALRAPGSSRYKFRWYRNDTLLTDSTQQIYAKSPGKFRAVAVRNAQCSLSTFPINISMKKAPQVSLSFSKAYCVSIDTLVLNQGSPGGGVYSGKGVTNDSLLLISSLSAGYHHIQYRYQDSAGCSGTATDSIQILPLPNVSAGNTVKACNNLDSIPLTNGTPSGGVYSGNGVYNNSFFPDSLTGSTGFFTVNYTVTDKNNCSNSAQGLVQLVAATPVNIEPINDLCSNEDEYRVDIKPFGGKLRGDALNGRFIQPWKADTGWNYITYTYTNIDNCVSRDEDSFKVFEAPNASWSGDDSVCLNGGVISLSGALPTGGLYYGSAVDSIQSIFKPKLAGPGIDTAFYRYTDNNGCSDTVLALIEVWDTTDLALLNNSGLCAVDSSISLNNFNPSSGIYTGNGVANNRVNPEKLGVGNHDIEYWYTNANGCLSRSGFVLEVYEIPDVQIHMPEDFCNGDPLYTVDSLQPSGGLLSGDVQNNTFNPVIGADSMYQIVYTYTDSFGCGSADTHDITVHNLPQIRWSGAEHCLEDDSVILNGASPAGGTYASNGKNITYFNPKSFGEGVFKLTYSVRNSFGCEADDTREFVVNPMPSKPEITLSQFGDTLFSSAASGNQWYKDGKLLTGETNSYIVPAEAGEFTVEVTNTFGCSTVSNMFDFEGTDIIDIQQSLESCYPNPTGGKLNFVGLQDGLAVEIRDLSGRLLEIQRIENASISLEAFDRGMYLLLIPERQLVARILKE